jgi:hypothetical protein
MFAINAKAAFFCMHEAAKRLVLGYNIAAI